MSKKRQAKQDRKPRAASGESVAMRRDGLVTAQEVAEATGLSLGTVHRSLDSGALPGGHRVPKGKYNMRYVDIHELLRSGVYNEAPPILEALRKLASVVDEASTAKATKPAPARA